MIQHTEICGHGKAKQALVSRIWATRVKDITQNQEGHQEKRKVFISGLLIRPAVEARQRQVISIKIGSSLNLSGPEPIRGGIPCA